MGCGYALPYNVAFEVDLPHRKAFSPDAAYYTSEMRMSALRGAPVFAVEFRSEGDYGKKMEREIAESNATISRQERWWCGMLI